MGASNWIVLPQQTQRDDAANELSNYGDETPIEGVANWNVLFHLTTLGSVSKWTVLLQKTPTEGPTN